MIKDPLSKQNKAIKEATVKGISKASLVHKIETLMDELKVMTEERDTLSKENERLTEENSNIQLLIGKK